jgi:hypothetical protein
MKQRISFGLVLGACVSTLAMGSAQAQVARALLRENGPLPGAPAGHTVQSLNNTAVNHVGGYAVAVNSTNGSATLSHVWVSASGGPGTVMRSEERSDRWCKPRSRAMASDAGNVSYSAGTGGPVGNFDSVWLDNTPICKGEPRPSRTVLCLRQPPGVTANGIPYWSSGCSNAGGIGPESSPFVERRCDDPAAGGTIGRSAVPFRDVSISFALVLGPDALYHIRS